LPSPYRAGDPSGTARTAGPDAERWEVIIAPDIDLEADLNATDDDGLC
jgi:hypothetical protein